MQGQLKRLENVSFQNQLGDRDANYRSHIPSVTNLAYTFTFAAAGKSKLFLTWVDDPDPRVAEYEIWMIELPDVSDRRAYKISSAPHSPANLTIISTAPMNISLYVVTVMKSGEKLPLSFAPSIPMGIL
jgi:hypothetical protein